jgi:hypothetical protein
VDTKSKVVTALDKTEKNEPNTREAQTKIFLRLGFYFSEN